MPMHSKGPELVITKIVFRRGKGGHEGSLRHGPRQTGRILQASGGLGRGHQELYLLQRHAQGRPSKVGPILSPRGPIPRGPRTRGPRAMHGKHKQTCSQLQIISCVLCWT